MRVVDFGQGVAGPYCGMLLGDFGADVIKIEPPRGDWSRALGARLTGGQSATSLSVNRNKRSVCLDLASAEGRRLAGALIARADVVVESFRPGVMARMGFDYATLAGERPELIYCSITGYGPDGPYAHLPAGDSTMQAIGGLMSIVGDASTPPTRVGNVVSDMLAGMHGFEAVLLALLERRTTGRGRHLNVSLFDTMLAFQAAPIVEYLMTGNLPPRLGNAHPLIAPSGLVQTADQPIALTVLDHQWQRFCKAMNFDELYDDPRFATNELRFEHRTALLAAISSGFADRSAAEVIDDLRRNDFLCAPVNTYAEVCTDPQAVHNESIVHATHATLGRVPMLANPIRTGDDDGLFRVGPGLGEHTREVLVTDLGLTPADVDILASAGAIVCGGAVPAESAAGSVSADSRGISAAERT